ncbi:RnfABCDGE type electron transport complex subunit G [Metapseudomonas boanensis]|uniref:Ion-translocating oxidoreductase complex subunit G n=1 Tax=Metapseudomonas boanensis TaxID=2822138 RepID=A0ABS5XA96_9GAMM|nr:RnfABCDGE type electron transport complex subunit G [Pseudomonas boanensis]MBT8764609.1 RnfABCDGE type electron transport complex subunit G [Pseudomonas boanensis]
MSARQIGHLALIAILGLAILIGLQQALGGRIEAERQAAAERALLDLLPPGSYDNHPLARPIAIQAAELLGSPEPPAAWLATRQGSPSAVLLKARAKGYEGPIQLLLAIRPDGRLLAVKVLAHRETPGIGDRIEAARSSWLESFSGHSLASYPNQEWRVKADKGQFDEIAGATITSRAVVTATQHALQFFDRNRDRLLAPTKEPTP